MDSSKKEGGIVQLVVVLGLITFVCALLLGFINAVTQDKIAQNNENTRNEAMAVIMQDADSFEQVEVSEEWTAPEDKNQPKISGVYEALSGGESIGYCVEVKPKGFGGELTMIVGINADGTVAGAQDQPSTARPRASAPRRRPIRTGSPSLRGQPADGSLLSPRTAARSRPSPVLPSRPARSRSA